MRIAASWAMKIDNQIPAASGGTFLPFIFLLLSIPSIFLAGKCHIRAAIELYAITQM